MDNQATRVDTIETNELADLLANEKDNVKLVCATWNGGSQDPVKQFEEAHIPGSAYFNITDIADKSTGLVATLPNKEDFINHMKRLGIKKNHKIVIYEHDRILIGPRVSWMLRIYGAKDVRILNGCLKKWKEEDRETATGKPEDANDTSDEGYDYERNDKMYRTLIQTLRHSYDAEGKHLFTIIKFL